MSNNFKLAHVVTDLTSQFLLFIVKSACFKQKYYQFSISNFEPYMFALFCVFVVYYTGNVQFSAIYELIVFVLSSIYLF